MSWITITIVVVFFTVSIGYFIVKRLSLNGLNHALQSKDYELVVKLSDVAMTRKLLGAYICDLYKLRAYVLMKNNGLVVSQAKNMLLETYTVDQRKSFLELYFHIFLSRNDLEMVHIFLEEIKKIEDFAYVAYNDFTYQVLIDKRNDLIEDMEKMIDTKIYHGNPLGTLVYLIAIQYLYLDDKKNALIFFKESLTCFHPNSVYVGLAKKQIKQLENTTI